MNRIGDEGAPATWFCSKYGVTMLAAEAETFCARRYGAAHQDDSCRISFSLCRSCRRGASAYKRTAGSGNTVGRRRRAVVL